MYTASSIPYYDKLYASQGKDYRKEAEYLVAVIRSRTKGKQASLLDVACGTGSHLTYLSKYFRVEGVDVSLEFIKTARSQMPKHTFYVGDMRTFRTGKEYSVVTCLFSSIGFMETPTKLLSALRNMVRHVKAGGLLIIEPWFSPNQIVGGKVSMSIVNEDRLKVVRMNTTKVTGNVSSLDFHYLVGTPKGTEHFVEKHKLGLYSKEQMMQAMTDSGLSVVHDAKGPTGRGLFIGTKQ